MTILFSFLYHHLFQRGLKEEIYRMHKYLKISLDEIYRMPVDHRRDFIKIHNKVIEEEEKKLKS
jgi:hypothetical protein